MTAQRSKTRLLLPLAAATAICLSPTAHAGLIDLPGLNSITFFEVTNVTTAYTLAANGTQLATRLNDPLGAVNSDFNGLTVENYDVFYSDPNGRPNLHGDCVTIEGVFSNPNGGGGLNIAQVVFNFGNGSTAANLLCSAVYHGNNFTAGSAMNAVDGNPFTSTQMGSTANYPAADPTRLRVTVGLVPEPTTAWLVGPLALALWFRVVRLHKDRRQHSHDTALKCGGAAPPRST